MFTDSTMGFITIQPLLWECVVYFFQTSKEMGKSGLARSGFSLTSTGGPWPCDLLKNKTLSFVLLLFFFRTQHFLSPHPDLKNIRDRLQVLEENRKRNSQSCFVKVFVVVSPTQLPLRSSNFLNPWEKKGCFRSWDRNCEGRKSEFNVERFRKTLF